MLWIDSATLGHSDARTHSGSLSHPMYSDGINCARLRRCGGLSHTPAVYHACGWLWRAVAATMLAVAVIVACACVQSVRCYAVRWCPVCYAHRCSVPAILAAGMVDACAGCMLAAGSSIGYRRKRSRRSDAMRGLSAALHPAASVTASCSYRRSVGHLSAVWPVSGGLGMGQCLRPVAVSAGVAVSGRSVGCLSGGIVRHPAGHPSSGARPSEGVCLLHLPAFFRSFAQHKNHYI